MPRKNRGRGAALRGALGAVLLIAGLTACAPLVGGAALLGAVGIAALSSRCYDYVDVTVLDADGRKTCAATVTASKGGSKFELPSCYYASLTDGRWKLRASLPGSADALTTVEVAHPHDCTRYVQTVELTLKRPGSSAPEQRSLPSPPASAEPSPSATPNLPAPVQSPEPAVPSSATPPLGSATPPVGVFPDSAQTAH